jgi:hypothetical protein
MFVSIKSTNLDVPPNRPSWMIDTLSASGILNAIVNAPGLTQPGAYRIRTDAGEGVKSAKFQTETLV